VWIATVDNIDWPSTSALGNVARQKQEFIRILNQHQRNGLNAIVMQVRPAADAFYPSRLEPWSEWLTGQQGKPPSPYYDPLLFMIEEAHKRNMEIHAWINPYRAVFNTNKTKLAPTHISKIHPEWFFTYGDKRYFDPGNPEGQQHVLRVVKDLAERYSELDAIHMDDYFYPYKIPGKEFPDAASFAKYGRNLNKDDWRRSNCDSIVKHIAEVIKSVNPQMRFGISPFGVWRNNDKDPEGSNSRAGATNYDDLYANILLWLQKGWIDYVVPQLYWEMEHPKVAFEVLIDWWASHAYGRHLYIGQGVYKVNEKTAKGWKEKDQLPRQIRLLREYETVQGSVIFSSKSIERNPFNWCDSLQENYYRYPALLPALPWIDSVPPPKPSVNYSYGGKVQMVLLKKAEKSETIKSFVIYAFDKTKPMDAENPANIYKIIPAMSKETKVDLSALAEKRATHQFAVTAVDWVNNESELMPLKL
jgi:uncharacterized lipoprotein YddW (UPF0748 family)